MTVPAFSREDLAATAQQIRDRLNGDHETLALLQELLDQAEQNNEQWQDQLSELQQGQSAIAKAVVMLARQNGGINKRLESMNKGLASLYRMQKAQGTGKPLGKSLLSRGQQTPANQEGGRTLEEQSRLGLLSKAIINTLGPRGGHSYPYNPGLASKMMLAGTLTAKQHKTWKASNRLHDDPWQHLQGRRAG
jgi:hypothetical protein